MVYIQDKEITILLIQGYPGRRPQTLDETGLGTPFYQGLSRFIRRNIKVVVIFWIPTIPE